MSATPNKEPPGSEQSLHVVAARHLNQSAATNQGEQTRDQIPHPHSTEMRTYKKWTTILAGPHQRSLFVCLFVVLEDLWRQLHSVLTYSCKQHKWPVSGLVTMEDTKLSGSSHCVSGSFNTRETLSPIASQIPSNQDHGYLSLQDTRSKG